MVLPKIFEKFLPSKEKKSEYFLVLQIKSDHVKVALFGKQEEQVTVVGIGQADHHGEWEEIVKAADATIINASGDLPQEEIEKVIFGLPHLWVEEDRILPDNLRELKKLCLALSLKPLGFVVNSEALSHYLKEIEESPPTAILIERQKKEVTVTLVKAGKIEGSRTESCEGPNAETVAKILENFPQVEVLPSRILLYDGLALESLKEDLLAYPWLQKLPFLHLPKIEILEKDAEIKAVAFASATQLGAKIEFEAKETSEALGFVKKRDILEEQESPPQPLPQFEEEKKPGLKLPPIKIPWRPHFDFNLEFFGKIKWVLLALILVLILGGGIFIASYWYLPKAKLELLVEPKTKESEVEITVDPSLGLVEESEKQIPGKPVEVELSASKTTLTTGKKNVGDPAKGEVTIYNKTENEKNFPSGAIIVGPNNLKFTLDEDVSLASTAAFSTTLSSAKAKVTASQVGPESNLPPETNFALKDFPTSSYFAKNEKEFSGGTSREIPVVSKADQDRLLATLSAELTEKAKNELQGKLGEGEKLIEKIFTSSVKQKKFDKEKDEEAKELTLNLAMAFKSLAFGEKDLKGILVKMMQETVPQGYELKEEELRFEISSVEVKKEGLAILRINFSANLLPKLNLEEIKKNIAGKPPKVAEDYLKNLGNISEVRINLYRSFPGRLRTLPRLPQNIKIEVRSI